MTTANIGFKGNCQTTAMGIMPHTDIDRALELSLSLDIPFWPQLPNVSYYEDMYVQASEHFPGITVDTEEKKLHFDNARFEKELPLYSEKMAAAETFTLSGEYSAVYHRFLDKDLHAYSAIRGQLIGPVSFGFRVTDENNRPLIYNEEVKTLVFDFMQRKVNAQCRELKEKNRNAFVWMDEPGLGWVFSGLSGYSDTRARQDYQDFLGGITGIRSLHLCANVNLPYLLGMGTELLSFDAYQIQLMPKGYVAAVARFLAGGGIISWGIVPTDSATLEQETPERLAGLIGGYWEVIAANSDIQLRQIAEQALVAPARCCLKNIGKVGASGETAGGSCPAGAPTSEERVVGMAFEYVKSVSRVLRERFGL